MEKLEVQKAVPEDFDRIYPLLEEFNSPHISRDMWKRLFYPSWETGPDYYCGYMLVNGEKAEGFLGYIFSTVTTAGGADYKHCNLTSWIVHEEYRGQSLELFYPAMKLDDHVISDFSPTKAVLKMFNKRYKFEILENGLTFLYPAPFFSGKSCRISFDDSLRTDTLEGRDKAIHNDHSPLNLRHILIENDQGYCYIVAKNRRYKKFRHLEFLYVSDPAVLTASAGPAMRALCAHYLVFGAFVDNRLLRGEKLPFSRTIAPLVTTLYKSSIDIDPADISQLYSEKVLLI